MGSHITNKTLVKDTNIFEGATISLMTPKPVEKEEAIRLIEAALLTNGYAIVADPDGKSARILPTRGQGVQAMQFSAGVRFYTSEKDLPTGETLVTYFMKLEYLEPTQASEILANHVGLNVYGRITPVLAPPGLLITESATIVWQLIGIRTAIVATTSGATAIRAAELLPGFAMVAVTHSAGFRGPDTPSFCSPWAAPTAACWPIRCSG